MVAEEDLGNGRVIAIASSLVGGIVNTMLSIGKTWRKCWKDCVSQVDCGGVFDGMMGLKGHQSRLVFLTGGQGQAVSMSSRGR